MFVEHADARAHPRCDASPIPPGRLQPKPTDLPPNTNLNISSALDPAPPQLLSKPAATAVQDVAGLLGDDEPGSGHENRLAQPVSDRIGRQLRA